MGRDGGVGGDWAGGPTGGVDGVRAAAVERCVCGGGCFMTIQHVASVLSLLAGAQ